MKLAALDDLKRVGDVTPKTPMEQLSPAVSCFRLKYFFAAVRYHVHCVCKLLISHPLFEVVTLLLICANCVTLAIDDPTDLEVPEWHEQMDLAFQIIYTAELVVKIFALGLIIPEGAFLRDPWNIVDLIIVVLGYLQPLSFYSANFDPRPLRAFRLFRPLRAVTEIEGIRAIAGVLSSSASLLLYVGAIYAFCLVVFAVVGFQLWHGVFDVRCANEENAEFDVLRLCGYLKCPAGYTCAHYPQSLNNGLTDFDDFFSSLLIAFIVSTDEGWPEIQKSLIAVEGYHVTVYFTLIVLIGANFLRHFVLGVFQYNVALTYSESQRVAEKRPSLTSAAVHKCKTLRVPKFCENEFGAKSKCRISFRGCGGLETGGYQSEHHSRPCKRTNGNRGRRKFG